MPLRVWRTDQVTPLSPHRNDPGPGQDLQETGAEFLTTFTVAIRRHARPGRGRHMDGISGWVPDTVGRADRGCSAHGRAAAGRAGSIA